MIPLRDDNPTRRRAWVTLALIAVNIYVFVGPQGTNDPQRVDATMALEWAAIPCEVVTGHGLTPLEIQATFVQNDTTACDLDTQGTPLFPDKPTRLAVLTSMFMHAGWLHLLGNVWFLWLFGNNVEDWLGHTRYLAFYLLGGVVATVAHIAVQPDSTIPVVGASGAVAATMGAYAVWFPNAPIRTLVVIVLWRIRAKWWLGFWFVSQFFIGGDSPVAWAAHVGGFVFGALVALLVRSSPTMQRRILAAPPGAGRWDTTGGAGAPAYGRPQRIIGRRR